MPLPQLFSFLFYIAFAADLMIGVYVLSLKTKAYLNRYFFAICVALCVSTFSFCISNSAPDATNAIYWRRIAVLGWGSVYSLMLHFLLILTENKNLLKKKWIYVLIYLPSAFFGFTFGISNAAQVQYNMVSTSIGWVNVRTYNWVDISVLMYYLLFSITGIILLWRWGRASKEKKKLRQSRYLIIAYIIAMLLCCLSESVLNQYTHIKVPQCAPVIAMIPMLAVFYCIKRYGLLDSYLKPESTDPGKVLSEANIEKFYGYISSMFILGGMLSFAVQYLYQHKPLFYPLMLLIYFLANGFIMQLVTHLHLKPRTKENIFIALVSIAIPVSTLGFIDDASITVWVIPAFYIFVSVMFNRRQTMFMLGGIIVATQIALWIIVPEAAVYVGGADYLARIGIFILLILLASYINRVYIFRLKENKDQILFQKAVAKISSGFMRVNAANLDERIAELLQLSGETFKVDRTFLLGISDLLKSYEWYKEGMEQTKDKIPDYETGKYHWWDSQMQTFDVLVVNDVDLLQSEAAKEYDLWKKNKMRSIIAIPIHKKRNILGFLMFATLDRKMEWTENHKEMIRILANLLSDALRKVDTEKEISYMAYYDSLTGLPNHTLFKNRLKKAIYLANRTEKLLGVVFIDLDAFKTVNDTVGHLGGDEMLKQVAERLLGCVRKQDTVSRMAGDEFLILLTHIEHIEDIKKIAHKIIKSFEKPLTVKDQEFFVTASAGVAVYPEDGEDPEELIKNADLAMYASKEDGKNRYAMCSSDMKTDVLRKMKLTNSLYRVQERNELVLFYQLQMNVSENRIVGVEALLRWKHPEMGMITPDAFIPLAERTGLINPIGEWVLKTACRQNMEWRAMGLPSLRVAVNLSVEQFRDPNLTGIVARTLEETGMEAEYLELEITESATVKEAGYIVNVLYELKELGVKIAIDDFGIEYSSLNRLKMLPVDRIKIDMQFVHGIVNGSKDEAIAKTIIQMGHNLNLHVIAEGVETEDQLAFFKEQKCDEIQGYFFNRPMIAEELEEILFKHFGKEKED